MATDKTILLITGGNTGLGLEAVKALCQGETAYEIIIGCRTVSKGDNAIAELKKQFPQTTSTLSTVQVDLESDESLQNAVSELSSKHGRLDVLINNGGASFDYDILEGRMSMRDGFNASWNVNVTGTHVLTTLAVPLLLNSANPRLIFLASGTATLTETERSDTPALNRLNASPPAGWPKPSFGMATTAYRSSKTGLNMLMREWRRVLLNDGVKVWAVSPGFLATGLAGVGEEKLKQMGALDPSIGANFLKDVVEGKRDHDEGKVIRKDMIQPW
ncbi:putative NAD -binding protein [Rosellinia necatrix]|uniref:Putative NAD-binding protein n=1 Tax=Rosellinia necatrix TaxID=77044 RepID=A0A1W2TF40_ROSNE|nr:putative NAD -binding protein [Rosellinia necatrix]